MDNITHTLVGLAAGELLHRCLPDEPTESARSSRRRLLLVACAVASNFPDLDLVLSPLLPPPLGYLLHHRGHTHTILYCLPQAFVLIATLLMVWKSARELLRESVRARVGLSIATLSGFALHLSMDYLNSYGVHPFHPIDSRWFYGDMIFIVEPFFWAACAAPLVIMIESGKRRALATTLLIGAPAFFAYAGFLAWYSVLLLALTMVTLAIVESKYGPRRPTSLIAAFLAMVIFIAVQSFASGLAKRALASDLESDGDGYDLHDVAATPLPTNPFCWTFVSVESKASANSYRSRRGILSVADFVPVASCPLSIFRDGKSTRKTSGLEIVAVESGDLSLLKNSSRSNCHLAAWLRFSRVPFVEVHQATDLRFSSAGRPNFTKLDLAPSASRACPENVPGWVPPRSDILDFSN